MTGGAGGHCSEWPTPTASTAAARRTGIAHTFSPGLTDDPLADDRLASTAARFLSRGAPATDLYVQSNMMALTIRPLLRASLANGETITAFMPRAVKSWRSVSPKR